MFRSFAEVEEHVIEENVRRRLVLCGAEDDLSLGAVVDAKRKGIVSGILIGNGPKIRDLLAEMREPPEDYEIINEPREIRAATIAAQYVRDRRADLEMKGSVHTAIFLIPIKSPASGLFPEGSILNGATIFYYSDRNRLVFFADAAVNIAPTMEEKVKIVKNVAKLTRAFGYDKVKVAAVSALEEVNPDMPSSVDAGQLAKMDWGEDIILEGPFALDNALDADAARHKGLTSEVAGNADVLLMPEICAGNVLHKSIHYLAHLPSASVLCGATIPVVLTSRTDSPETKYNSILSAVLQCSG